MPPVGANIACDGPHGVDNKGGPLIGALFENDEALQESLSHGVQGIVVRLDRYNGQANDADVIASIYNVVGVNEKTDQTGTAKFDGTDSFIVDSDSVISDGEMRSKYFDAQAYVTDNVLVASIPIFRLRMMIPPSDNSKFEEVIEELRGVQLVGKVESEGENGLRIRNAVLTGRVPLQTMFLKAGPASVCNPDAGSFTAIKGTVCGSLDMTADPQADAAAGCDALSFALFLDVVPAQLRNGPKPAPPGKDACAPREITCP
ncbi:hypothetical protein LVJ94_36955 [Pendulispora rubella]|uniref:Uncharacterized protein n=1 Tax=Pendulispora rubella TaxID=2741070 RepID=A0ABZ2KV49_9BACT